MRDRRNQLAIKFGQNTVNPCYDTQTHTDCPNRKLGCRKNCAAWIEFETNKKTTTVKDEWLVYKNERKYRPEYKPIKKFR